MEIDTQASVTLLSVRFLFGPIPPTKDSYLVLPTQETISYLKASKRPVATVWTSSTLSIPKPMCARSWPHRRSPCQSHR
jgi:hypothetical protein